MRRGEKEIKDRAQIDSIIRESEVCRLGMCDGPEPYVVPLSFGYDGCALYFHSATEGRKLDILRRSSRVCFEFDIPEGLITGETACRWGIRYRSVIGVGVAEIVQEPERKREGLALIMRQYSDGAFTFPDEALKKTVIIRVRIESISGKQTPR